MNKEILEFIARCPEADALSGGVASDYFGGSSTALALKAEPAIKVLCRYQNGLCLLRRDFRLELYASLSGDTEEQIQTHARLEAVQKYIASALPPEIPEGEIVQISSAADGTALKSAIGEGLFCMRFSVVYRGRI